MYVESSQTPLQRQNSEPAPDQGKTPRRDGSSTPLGGSQWSAVLNVFISGRIKRDRNAFLESVSFIFVLSSV